MDRIVVIGGQAYLVNVAAMQRAAAYVPPLPLIDQAPTKLALKDLPVPLAYGPPISAASLVKEDRTEEILDLGRLILNGAELAKRKSDAERRGGN